MLLLFVIKVASLLSMSILFLGLGISIRFSNPLLFATLYR